MTIEKAKEEIPNFDRFVSMACDNCISNKWYCPKLCDALEEAKRLPLDKIQKAYARHDGNLQEVFSYIKQARIMAEYLLQEDERFLFEKDGKKYEMKVQEVEE